MFEPISLTFLGHSAWQISHGATTILIDPFITGNPQASVTADELQPTHIILTHAHGDHLGDTESIARRTGAKLISTYEVAKYLAARGFPDADGLGIGGGCKYDFGRVVFTIASHSSSFPDGSYGGASAGVIIKIAGRTIYHAGDTGLFHDMKLIGERHPIDVALLPIGDYFTMDICDAAYAVGLLRPKLAIPMHYNTFSNIEVDPNVFRTLVATRGMDALVMEPGQTHTLEPVYESLSI